MKENNKIDMSRIPAHIAFIMDGNRRWAKAKGLARSLGHSAGFTSMLKAVTRCVDLGVKYISFFAWSSDNWGREKSEVNDVLDLAREKADSSIKQIMKVGIKIVTMGDLTRFPKDLQDKLAKITDMSKNNKRGVLNLCINYGGREDIIQAIKKIKSPEEITAAAFEKLLYGADLPDVDFVVRTSGEQRLSNFMLWKTAYSELYFPKVFWPAIGEAFVDKCIIEYQKRNRRYGKD